MPETLYAAFADAAHAESAAGALLDHGVSAKDISLVLNEEGKKRVSGYEDAATIGSQPTAPNGPAGDTGTFDPLGNTLRGAVPPIPGGNLFPVGETAEVNADLNPAQNDYPAPARTRPPNSLPDRRTASTTGIPTSTRSRTTRTTRARRARRWTTRSGLEGDRDRARVDPASVNKENDEGVSSDMGIAATSHLPADPHAAGHVADVRDAGYDAERAAKAGVTTTTIQDAAKGAAKGVGYGLGLGALAAVASIAIPGFGLVLGGGALAAAVAGLAASAGAGAVAGASSATSRIRACPRTQIRPTRRRTRTAGPS